MLKNLVKQSCLRFVVFGFVIHIIGCGSGGSSEPVAKPPAPSPAPPAPKTVAEVWEKSQLESKTSRGYSLLDYSQSGYLGEAFPDDLLTLSPENFTSLEQANCPENGLTFESFDYPLFLASCFGVLPDDEQDDGNAIIAAIAHIKNQNGGVLYFAPGQYDFRNQHNLKGIEIDFSNMFFIGHRIDGENTVQFHLHGTYSGYDPSDWGDFNIFRFKSNQPRTLLEDLDTEIVQGENLLQVTPAVAKELEVGDVLSISFYNEDNDDALSRKLISPLNPDPSWHSFSRKEPFRWASKLTHVDIENGVIEFFHPFPTSISQETAKQLFQEHPISNVGMFNFRFTSNWQGEYCHHGLCGGLTPREIFDMDYGWSAFQVKNVRDSLFSNLSFDSYTFPVETSQTLNVTISNVLFTGIPGHQGIILRGWYNVFKHGVFDYDENYSFSPDVRAPIRPTHAMTTNGFSVGNVFYDAKALSDTVLTLDFHGRQPATKNLYDSIQNAFVNSAGPVHEMPHAGRENVFWNIQTMDTAMQRTGNQFVYSWLANKFYTVPDSYKFHPRTIFVNISNEEQEKVYFGNFEKDVSTSLVHVEGVNDEAGLKPFSLYCEQALFSDEQDCEPISEDEE